MNCIVEHQQTTNKITSQRKCEGKESKEKSFTNRHLEGKLNEKHLEKKCSSDSVKYNSSIILLKIQEKVAGK